MITTSFFSQSLCNSSAVIRRALSAGVAWFAGFCESSVSLELQASRPQVNTEANSKRIKQRIDFLHLAGGTLEYNFGGRLKVPVFTPGSVRSTRRRLAIRRRIPGRTMIEFAARQKEAG